MFLFQIIYCNLKLVDFTSVSESREKINLMTYKDFQGAALPFPSALYASPTLIKCIRGVDGEMLERTLKGFGLFKGFVAEM